MSEKKEMMSNHDAERGQGLPLSITPQLQVQTPTIDTIVNNNGQASSSAVGRRPRGRPRGAKNKPKMPVVVTRDISNALQSHLLEINDGDDVLKCLFNFAHRQGRGIHILSGNGAVKHIAIHHPMGRTITITRSFDILSISGKIIPLSTPENAEDLTIYLSSGTGKVIWGTPDPTAPFVASGLVKLTAISFAIIQ
jgi:hypothetical protein